MRNYQRVSTRVGNNLWLDFGFLWTQIKVDLVGNVDQHALRPQLCHPFYHLSWFEMNYNHNQILSFTVCLFFLSLLLSYIVSSVATYCSLSVYIIFYAVYVVVHATASMRLSATDSQSGLHQSQTLLWRSRIVGSVVLSPKLINKEACIIRMCVFYISISHCFRVW